MSSSQTIPLFNLAKINANRNGLFNPLPMQYLGSKARISRWILDQIQREYPQVTTFVDLFAGTGSVSIDAQARDYNLLVNDLQPYSFIVLKSLFQEPRISLTEVTEDIEKLKNDDYLLSSGRSEAHNLLNEERIQFNKSNAFGWRWEQYKDFCESTELIKGSQKEVEDLGIKGDWNLFIKYYANTYFGVEQCLQLDALREYAQNHPLKSIRVHLLAATITAMTYAVSSTTHLAQYLKPTSLKRSIHLIQKRRISLINEVKERLKNLSTFHLPKKPAKIFQYDFRKALKEIPLDERSIVYVDPPYFKEHYSRYYHVLDTFYLYDYPMLTYNKRISSTTVGRYRQDRYISDFGLKGAVQDAFSDLFSSIEKCGAKIAISYADTSLVAKEQLMSLAEKFNFKGTVKEIQLMHSGQGQPRNKNVKEYLFLLKRHS